MNLLRANSREPDRLEGDVYALVASNEAGANRLKRMMEEYRIADLDALSRHISGGKRQIDARGDREAAERLVDQCRCASTASTRRSTWSRR